MNKISFDDEIAAETLAKPDTNLKRRIGTKFGDTRTKEEMVENCEVRGKLEDEIASSICAVHNSLDLKLCMEVTPLGQRMGFIENMKKDPGDSLFSFTAEDKGFQIGIEIKMRDKGGTQFRPRVEDVDKCIKNNRPYLLVMNNKTDYCSLIFLFSSDLLKIKETHESMTKEIKSGGPMIPYGGKPYYRVENFKQYDRVNLSDLKFNGSLDIWKSMIKKLNQVAIEKQNG